METRAGLVAALLCLLQLAATSWAENIDTRQPIYRQPPEIQENAYFGYSVVLHRTTDSGNLFDRTSIVVSAPRYTVPGSPVSYTGAVFSCPVSQGSCEGLVGDGVGADEGLYDSRVNQPDEEKSEQFLGGSMVSNQDGFLVCGHRYVQRVGTDFRTPVGVCYATTNPLLRNFQRFELCPTAGDNLGRDSGGVCMLGTSSVITESNDQYTYAFGAPGYFSWRGLVIRRDSNGNVLRQTQGGPVQNGYQGYAMAAGYFLNTVRQDYAVSIPRADTYFGRVTIVTNDNSLSVVSQPDLRGQQVGEYYGFEVLSANLDGDGFDELLVSAPMYRANTTQPETGRVYLYRNNGGSLQLVRIIEGFAAFSRFGYAMTNLGDISGDGYDDIAIGAPFSGVDNNSPGTVYIYHSRRTQLLSMSPAQEIVGSELTITGSVTDTVRGFGSSLASGVDVDENTYNDLAIGSFMSQDVFLLRTRPLATITQSITASPQIVMLESPNCDLSGEMFSCFEVTFCMTYSGSGLSSSLNFDLIVRADINNIENRVFFSSPGMPTASETVTANIGQQLCRSQTAYIERGITDRFNPIVVDYSVMVEEVNIPEGDGNATPEDFSDYPVVSATGVSTVQIETFKNCSGAVCIPDLQLTVVEYRSVNEDGSSTRTSTVTLGETRNIVVETQVLNAGEDAFQASFTVAAPTLQVTIDRLSASLNNGVLTSLICPLTDTIMINEVDYTRVTCNIGNPLPGPGATLRVAATLIPQSARLTGNEAPIPILISATSVNPEDMATEADNQVDGVIEVRAAADVFLDNRGLVTPEVISYSNTPPNDTVVNATQLGPAFSVSFVVANTGPSTVRMVSLVINWPLSRTDAQDEEAFFLYPAQITTSGTGATATCMNTNINPGQLSLAEFQGVDDEEGQFIGEDESRRRRRRRSIVPHKKGRKLRKRQAVDMNAEDTEIRTTNNVTVSCADSDNTLNCVRIECTIIGLEGNGNARFDITGFLDERYFANTIDRFTIVPTAEIDVLDGSFLVQQNPEDGKMASAFVRVIPAESPVTVERQAVPWWVIFLAVLAVVIILAVVVGILWALGFFRRRKHEELKQKREELQNLETNAKSPDDAVSTDNIVDGSNL